MVYGRNGKKRLLFLDQGDMPKLWLSRNKNKEVKDTSVVISKGWEQTEEKGGKRKIDGIWCMFQKGNMYRPGVQTLTQYIGTGWLIEMQPDQAVTSEFHIFPAWTCLFCV